MTEENLARKKKVRAAHRASVTRMIGQANELLNAEGRLESAKLKQKREALTAKAELLNKLDADIVEAVGEDYLEEKIEVADTVQERIELAIIELAGALDAATVDEGRRRREEERAPTRNPSAQSPTHSPPADHSRGVSPSRESTHEPLHGGGDTRESTPTSERDSGLSEIVSPRPTHIKLPKLSLKRFNGDLTRWTTFWDTFESAVHNNPTLSDIDKFNYLVSLLESTAAEAIAGLTLTAANYEEAVTTLKRRFGNRQAIINRHMDILLRHEPVTSVHNLKGLRHLFDTLESNVRGLRALGVTTSSYGGFLSPILISRLPTELRLIVSRELKEEDWDLERVREVFQREVEARERTAVAVPS